MGVKGMVALATASIALLAGPGTAWAQDDGTAGAPTPAVESDTAVEPAQDSATTTTGSEDTSAVTSDASDLASSGASEDVSSEATAEPAAATSDDVAPADATVAQSEPQVETSVQAASDVRTASAVKKSGDSCGLARAAASPNGQGVGPPGPGCTRVDGGQISSDPNNPTVLPAINGVTVAIWIENTASGPVVHWAIQSGTFSGTDAINLKVKGGPDPNGFTCQISNATPTGVCHAPVNPNNGKFYGVSHVEACPGSTTAPPVNTPPGAGGVAGQVGKGGEKPQQGVAGENVPVAAAAPGVAAEAAQAAGGLPVTGLAAVWLFLIGGALLTGGALLRTRTD